MPVMINQWMKSVILKQCSYTTFSILYEVSLSFPCASLGTLSNAKEDVDQKDKFLLLVTELHKWLDVFTASHGAITLLVNRVEFKIETLKNFCRRGSGSHTTNILVISRCCFAEEG